jgi:hypothetical protein
MRAMRQSLSLSDNHTQFLQKSHILTQLGFKRVQISKNGLPIGDKIRALLDYLGDRRRKKLLDEGLLSL